MTTFSEDEIRIAQAFHEAYEELAPIHGYKTREASAVPWEDVPDTNKHLMCATVHLLLRRSVIVAGEPINEKSVLRDEHLRRGQEGLHFGVFWNPAGTNTWECVGLFYDEDAAFSAFEQYDPGSRGRLEISQIYGCAYADNR